MPFIQNSVGLNGINDRVDVKIIAELILIAHDNKPFLSQPVLNDLGKTGRLFDIAVDQAIIEFIRIRF